MKCSKLNAHLLTLHVVYSPSCSCGYDIEDTNHYLFNCPLYTFARNIIFNEIRTLCNIEITENILLEGKPELDYQTNKAIFLLVFGYIEETDRL